MAVLPALVFAYPAIGGGRGLFRVQNALVESEAGLTVSLHALARNADFGTLDKSGWIADLIAPELSYAPIATKYVGLELFGSWGGQFQTPKSDTAGGFIWGSHDLKAGGKLSIPVIPVLKIGGTANYTFMGRESNDPSKKPGWTVLDPEALPYDPGQKLAWSGLVTLQFQDVMPSAPNLIVNYGKVGSETQYAAAVELQGTGFGLFVEGVSLQRSGTDIFSTTNGHLHLTPGVVLGSAPEGFLKLGYTFSSGTADSVKQPNEIILGFGFATPFGKRVPAQFGQVAGTVVDSRTGAPLAATISFPENAKLSSLSADPATGVFQLKKVAVGVLVVEAVADGYGRQAMPIEVTDGGVTQYAFKLTPLKAYGTIAGAVTDAATSKPLAARVEFGGGRYGPVTSDPVTGAFRVDKVEVGVYTLTASADKYITATQSMSVEDGKLANAVFTLNSAVSITLITGKVSDKKTGDPLAASVAFSGATGSPTAVATDPATGVYQAQLAPSYYAVTIEAADYIKQTAAIIVEKDKPQVKDFELVKEGMAITLRGIYFDFNKATIKPESKPALDDAAKMLKDNPTITVEIQGHTDSQGSDSYNLNLSDQRAGSVVTYLIQNYGIAMNRLTAKGYGEANPIATNDTDSGRALNRRVEFVIVGQLK
jgi:outer membrane protein OmpA-like peptidoglycan-associated protein